jgi:hypothetical protein
MKTNASARKGKHDGITDEKRQQVEEFFRQTALAERRMGRTPEARLRWVVEFSQLDLESLRPEERVAKGYDLRQLAVLGVPNPGVADSWVCDVGPMPDEALRQYQADIAQGIRGLLANPPQEWSIPAPAEIHIQRFSTAGARKTGFYTVRQGDERQRILGAVADLLLAAGSALRACAECGRPLVARKRQVYCTQSCSQRARDRHRPPRPSRAKAAGEEARR